MMYTARMPAAPDFQALDCKALEELYRTAPRGPDPTGSFRGKLLCYLDSPGARKKSVRALDWLLFEAPAFGVDFDRKRWWFLHPRLVAGRFDWSLGPSRWRETETLRLSYRNSRLPKPVRAILYDEIKPLADGTCLGLGGIDRERGEGDHFFFSLIPLAAK